jgi:hypothetical protein
MTWLTWRQHRVQIIGLLAMAILVTVGTWLVAEYAMRLRAELGIDTCVPEKTTILTPTGPQVLLNSQHCADLVTEWQRRIGPLRYAYFALYVIPALVASYIGGPLFALEFERATHRLAWTQSISRVHWAGLKLGIVLVGAFIAALILAAAGGPSEVLMGVGRTGSVVRPFEVFDLGGPALASYIVFGIAMAAFAGALSRRILGGMLIGLLVFGAVRVGVHNLRPMYQEPAIAPYPGFSSPFAPSANAIPPDAWVIGVNSIDLEGRPVPQERVTELLQQYISTRPINTPTSNDSTFLREHGVIRRWAYQPADRFWTFQAIEAAIFFGLAALFAFLTVWRVRTRDA